jgi:inositol oxygenase
MKPYLSDEALYMLRFHSFYAWHRHGAYQHLENEKDKAMLEWVRKFNPYDLYRRYWTLMLLLFPWQPAPSRV